LILIFKKTTNMEYIKTFEDFINESIVNESNTEAIAKLKSKINSLTGDLENVPRGQSGAKQRMKAELEKAKTELKKLSESNKSILNESSSLDLHGYVKKAADKAQAKGGNGVNISDYGAFELAGSLESYYKEGNGDGNIYTDKTIKLFKQLIDSMVDDEIKNNQVDEGLNESRLTGKETSYNSKQFLQYFQDKYPYIGPNVSSRDLEKWLKQDVIKRVNLEKAADYFQDYVLANGLADVQESEVSEAVGTLQDKYDALIKALEKAKVPCRVKLTNDEVIIECGWNYPDRIADKVFDAADLVGLKDSEISVSAEHSGPGVIDTKKINGGPKRY